MTTVELRARASRLIDNGDGQSLATLDAHLRRHGELPIPQRYSPDWADRLLVEIERSGLTGRGGAGFPTFKKLRLAQSGPQPILVVNIMEGEPASDKDRFLVAFAPHLILDGADLVTRALNARRTVICVPNDAPELSQPLARALAERRAPPLTAAATEVRALPGRYIAGEESALAAAVAGGTGIPRYRPDKSVPLSIGHRGALVHNAETLANVALIARYGAEWFAEVGSADAPGTCLVTIGGGVERPGVVEVATGTPVRDILALARPAATVQAVLVGGYGGTWLSGDNMGVPYAPGELRSLGASMGAGVLIALPAAACGIRETERIARFMAAESAGQCGPCLFGLPAIADDLRTVANGEADLEVRRRLAARCATVAGRGACHHPDGVVRLVRSALEVFSPDVAGHIRGVPCAGSTRPSVLGAWLPGRRTEQRS
jgi:NADH:ubiquinone oxidoreductase subunit F (NADH-binding)